MTDTVNSNLDFTYTNLAPLSQQAEEALESGLNPNQFVFAEPEEPEVEIVTSSQTQKRSRKKKAKGADDDAD